MASTMTRTGYAGIPVLTLWPELQPLGASASCLIHPSAEYVVSQLACATGKYRQGITCLEQGFKEGLEVLVLLVHDHVGGQGGSKLLKVLQEEVEKMTGNIFKHLKNM
jgi:hypothetical protein